MSSSYAAVPPRSSANEEDFHDDRPSQPSPGDDFTIRAVVVGLLVGVILCMTNIYFGLQTGWVSMMSLQSALLGYAIFLVLPSILPSFFSKPFTPQENVILQTTAVATGTMPLAAGLVGIIPALEQLNVKLDNQEPIILSSYKLILWCLAVAFFGVFLAAPLRKQVIVKEKLVFPSGTATAQLIGLLHKTPVSLDVKKEGGAGKGYRRIPRDSEEIREGSGNDSDEVGASGVSKEEAQEIMGGKGWWALGWSFAASGLLTFASFLFPVLYSIPLFDPIGLPFGAHLASKWLWWFSPSLSYVGQGIIMGFPVTVSMNLGMFVGWGILSPLAKHLGWAPGVVGSTTDGSRGWILWVALAIMISESIVSLLPILKSSVERQMSNRSNTKTTGIFVSQSPRNSSESYDEVDPSKVDEDDEHEPPERLVPTPWIIWGLGISGLMGVVLVWIVFGKEGIHPWATAVGLVLASGLAVVGVRALGETDLNPVSGIGKISQLLFAVLQPGNVVANVIAGGVAEAGAQQAGDLMQDLKTGHLLHASPRSQFYGQLIGSFASIFVSVAGYKFYTSVYEIPGPQFSVPSASVWLNLARLLNHGKLPDMVIPFMLAFGLFFAGLSGVKAFYAARDKETPSFVRYIPSGIAFAVGFLNTPSFSIARLLGGYVAYKTSQSNVQGGKRTTPLIVVVIASGFVLGEGVLSILSLILTSAGYKALSCWGCNLGGGGYCGGGCG